MDQVPLARWRHALDAEEPATLHEKYAPGFAVEFGLDVERHADPGHRVVAAMSHSLDPRGRLASVSDAWLLKLGYERREVVGRAFADFLSPGRRVVRKADLGSPSSGACVTVYRMTRKDGGVLDVLLSAVPVDGPGGDGRLVVVTDVTELLDANRRLAESEARYRSLIENQSELVSLITPEGELLCVNRAYASFHGRRPETLVGENVLGLAPQEARGALQDHLRRVCETPGCVEHENEVLLPGGEKRWVAWTHRALRDDEGKIAVVHSVGRDIQVRVDAERRRLEVEAQYRLLAENSTDMVFQLDRDLVRRYVSPACREIFGYEPEQLIGVKCLSTAHPDDAARVLSAYHELMRSSGARLSVACRMRHKDGRWIWVEGEMRVLRSAQTQELVGVIGSLRDISARKAIEVELSEANRRLQALAAEDALTGLANRRKFDESITTLYSRAQLNQGEMALIMIDVDHFKAFNDVYGHPRGDDCLRRIAEAISQTTRRSADVVARYGGEEFAVILPATDEAGALAIALRIQQAVLRLEIPHEGHPHGLVTISSGVAAAKSPHDDSATRLVQQADRALYLAKSGGRNRVVLASASDIVVSSAPSAAA